MFPEKKTYTVSEITTILRNVVESEPRFRDCWIEGEISGLARPRSGHIYFKLKDDDSQINCAMFRQAAQRLKFPPKDGDAVFLHGYLGIYEARSEYQIIGDRMERPVSVRCSWLLNDSKSNLRGKGCSTPLTRNRCRNFPNGLGLSRRRRVRRFRTSSVCWAEGIRWSRWCCVPRLCRGTRRRR